MYELAKKDYTHCYTHHFLKQFLNPTLSEILQCPRFEGFFFNKKMKTLKIFCSLLLATFITCISCLGNLRVHFIDVGEGDAILIQMPDNKNILIDSGNLSAGYKVIKYLKSIKISRLDCIIVTHMHPDHVGGIFHILPKIRTNLIYYNGYRPKKNEYFFELINLSQELKIPLKILNARKHLIYGKVHINVLSPIEPFSRNMNEDSIVLRLNFCKISLLLAADLTINGEKRLMELDTNLKSDILKVGHHGAEDSNSEEFIDKVNPKLAVLSVGKHNRYGYPSKKVIERFKIRKIPLYRTDIHGTIIIQTDGNTLAIKKERL